MFSAWCVRPICGLGWNATDRRDRPGCPRDRWAPQDSTLLERVGSGVEVVRLAPPEPEPRDGLGRYVERAFGRDSRFEEWWVRGAFEAGLRLGRGADVILGELVPYPTAVAASRLSRELDVPWVADLQDPWALDEMWLYPTAVHRLRDRARMRRLLGTASAIVMNTPEAVVRLATAFPELRTKNVSAVPNGFDADDFEDDSPPRLSSSKFSIVHAGYLHTEFGLRHRATGRYRRVLGGMPVPGVDYLSRSHWFLVAALERVLVSDPTAARDLELYLAGVVSNVDRSIVANGITTHFPGYVSHAETIRMLRGADLLFLPMQTLPADVRAGLVPGKTYEYLAAGRPILAAVPEGDARDLLLEAGGAAICDPPDVDCLAQSIRRSLDSWRLGEDVPVPSREVAERFEGRRLAESLHDVLFSAARDRMRS